MKIVEDALSHATHLTSINLFCNSFNIATAQRLRTRFTSLPASWGGESGDGCEALVRDWKTENEAEGSFFRTESDDVDLEGVIDSAIEAEDDEEVKERLWYMLSAFYHASRGSRFPRISLPEDLDAFGYEKYAGGLSLRSFTGGTGKQSTLALPNPPSEVYHLSILGPSDLILMACNVEHLTSIDLAGHHGICHGDGGASIWAIESSFNPGTPAGLNRTLPVLCYIYAHGRVTV